MIVGIGRAGRTCEHRRNREPATDEILVKRRLEHPHDRTLDADLRVAPVLRVLRVPQPVIRHPDSASECHGPVDDQNLPMRAVIQFLERVPVRGIEVDDIAPSLPQPLEMGVVHAAGADRVENHVHHDAAARRLLERVGELVGHATFVIHVRF